MPLPNTVGRGRAVLRNALVFALLTGPAAAQTLSVSQSTSLPSPAPVGTIVTWTANADGSQNGNVWYRFRVRERGTVSAGCRSRLTPSSSAPCADQGFSAIRDYGPVNTIDWTASDHEGGYEIEASARDNDTGAIAANTAAFQFTALATADTGPVITPTANPLVFLYSAPPCPAASTMQVQFQGPEGMQSTNAKPCNGRTTMNFYLAGMLSGSVYYVQHVVEAGSVATTGSVTAQSTPDDPGFDFAPRIVTVPPPDPFPNPVILQARFGFPAATDANGNLIWYSLQAISDLARPEPGGLFLGWYESGTVDPSYEFLREFDLAGTVLRETNVARMNEQLAAMGMHPITAFHHEVRGLPNGGILTIGSTERILTDVQGPGPVDVLGDIILVLDPNLQLQWAWDTFDHLDPHRMATLNETCVSGGAGCPPIYLAAQANDWTHGNSAQLTPDGNILYSARHQDWLIKIDYRNGLGTGNILWRLGKDGDFQFISGDPYPWFSHQHDANVDINGILTVFDNGNVRNAANPSANSRGQVIQLDEENRTATLLVNADLGDYSAALGSAQSLPDGNYHFHLGDIAGSETRVVEVDPQGSILYDMRIGEIQYRSFRMRDLYSP